MHGFTWEHRADNFCSSQGSLEGGCDQAESQRMNNNQARKEKVEGQAWQHKQEHGGEKQQNYVFLCKKKIRLVYILAKIHFLCNVRLWFTVWTLELDSLGVNLGSITYNLLYTLS